MLRRAAGADPGILKGGIQRNFLQRGGGGGGPTTYSRATCIANKQNLLKKGAGGGGTPWTPGSALNGIEEENMVDMHGHDSIPH